jgi:hypothetical protein
MDVIQVINTSPAPPLTERQALADCIRECVECALACSACADACLSESDIDMLRRCIRLNQDCADECDMTARMLTRQTEPAVDLVRRQVELLAAFCRACGDECARHPEHAHCRLCAEACRSCERACQSLLGGFRTPARA